MPAWTLRPRVGITVDAPIGHDGVPREIARLSWMDAAGGSAAGELWRGWRRITPCRRRSLRPQAATGPTDAAGLGVRKEARTARGVDGTRGATRQQLNDNVEHYKRGRVEQHRAGRTI